ncbi:LysR family transcriptional regulator [Sphingobium sp. DEHP117]|uniref:LysR family transcriptional regulator n=1 Tax=Sphingobium sp. DEHP117 TaxID=2993436 RepID=UPI0027D56310|nr:LysR substrate-binding domain-containing protein [Sphingobium sp. DEHP117]MDQ4420142.1 LysR family transcriptional regulator [Sphingobium sp. DEHP117]
MLSSDDLRVFLGIIRTGSTVGAARRLGIDHSTVSRRLTALEHQLDIRLFDRSPRGLTATSAAGPLIAHAERIEKELIAAAMSVTGRATAPTGVVRLATPEIFGTWVVAPRMHQFRAQFPGLTLELAPESRSVSLSKREADVAIALRPPPRGRLVVRKMADYNIGLYGAKAYLERHGAVIEVDALREHCFVSYIDELLDYPEMNVLDTAVPGAISVFRSSSSAAQHAAIAAGLGLGMLHRLAADQDPRLQRILPTEINAERSYWLVMHADLQRDPRVRAVSEFLSEAVRECELRF